MEKEFKKKYVVRENLAEAPDVFTLKLSREDGSATAYTPGQFINIYLGEEKLSRGKSYSISSEPAEETLNITVKKMGEFSNRLCVLNSGDNVFASEPCGYFYSDIKDTVLVFVAGGIGITPFRSIILDTVHNNPQRKIFLFYSNKTASDIIFLETFNYLQSKNGNFKATYFITREEQIPENMIRGRMNVDIILKIIGGEVSGAEFFICGSIFFTRDLWRGLRDAGISAEKLYTEAFFSQ